MILYRHSSDLPCTLLNELEPNKVHKHNLLALNTLKAVHLEVHMLFLFLQVLLSFLKHQLVLYHLLLLIVKFKYQMAIRWTFHYCIWLHNFHHLLHESYSQEYLLIIELNLFKNSQYAFLVHYYHTSKDYLYIHLHLLLLHLHPNEFKDLFETFNQLQLQPLTFSLHSC